MSKIYEILREVKETIAGNNELRDYCLEKFGKPHTVLIGVDEQNLPDVNLFPIVAIDRGESKYLARNLVVDVELEIKLVIAILWEECLQSGNVIEYTGIDIVENMAEMIRNTRLCSVPYVWSEGAPLVGHEGTRRYPVFAQEETIVAKITYERK